MICSRHLHNIIDVMFIGRKLLTSFLGPPLCIRVTTASRQTGGRTDALKNIVIISTKEETYFNAKNLSNIGDILSGPMDLRGSNDDRCDSTPCRWTFMSGLLLYSGFTTEVISAYRWLFYILEKWSAMLSGISSYVVSWILLMQLNCPLAWFIWAKW